MEGSSLLYSPWYSSARPMPIYSMLVPHPNFDLNLQRPSFNSLSRVGNYRSLVFIPKSLPKPNSNKNSAPQTSSRRSLGTCAFELQRDKSCYSLSTISPREMLPKTDKSGRFCSPRAARELALSMIYAACLEGSDPVRLFEKRINARREPGYEFDKDKLLEYNHMSFGGPPVTVESVDEANELLKNNEKESAIEAEVLAAPLKLVYSKLILRFTRKLLVAVVDSWDSHVLVINKVTPANWKNEPAGRILEFSILHLAMSEMAVLGTRHQIVIDEAVDLAKRFCDGAAPRIINGCLRTFVKELEQTRSAMASESKQREFS